MAGPVVIAAAVESELSALVAVLAGGQSVRVGRALSAYAGTLDGCATLLLATGMGKVLAAASLAAVLERETAAGVLSVGVGGAYPGTDLAVGALALASEEILADDGVEQPGGFAGCEAIGIPLVAGLPGNRIPLDERLVARARAQLLERGLAVAVGPFATVSTCSGTDARAARQRERWGALVESMEGAALAAVARRYRTPFLELRAISNPCGDRDLAKWDLARAAAAAQAGARALLGVLA